MVSVSRGASNTGGNEERTNRSHPETHLVISPSVRRLEGGVFDGDLEIQVGIAELNC